MTRQASTPRRGLPPATPAVPAPADKRFRRSDVRLTRKRSGMRHLVRAAVFGGGGLLVLGLLAWAVTAFMGAEMFRIDRDRVIVRGNQRLSTPQVRALLEGIERDTVFLVDLDAYRARLLGSRWVADAVLRRVFPSNVEVRITERTPLAIARLNGQLFLVDATGMIMDSFGPQYREFDLPIVDGLLRDSEDRGLVEPRRLQLAARLLEEAAAEPGLFKRISQVDVTDPQNAVVLLEGETAQLRLGDRDFLERFRRYADAAATYPEPGEAVDYYDLRSPVVVAGPRVRAAVAVAAR